MEAVNIRAEQLSDVCADTLIPKRQISLLNKKFKLVTYQVEQEQSPEEKGNCIPFLSVKPLFKKSLFHLPKF